MSNISLEMSMNKQSAGRWSRAIGAIAISFAFTATTPAQADLTQYFQARYDALVKAYAAKDLATVQSILSPDYYSGAGPTRLNRAATIDDLKKSSGVFKTVYRKVTHVGFKKGIEYIVEDSMTTGKTHEKDTNIYHVIVLRQHCIDSWVKGPKDWQLKNINVIGTYTTRDGKRYRPKKQD